MADVFWTTSDAVAAHAQGEDILRLNDVLGEDVGPWESSVTDLYTRDGELWALPQVWEATVLYYNTALVDQAGVDATTLTWDPAAVATPTAPAGPAPEDAEPDAPATQSPAATTVAPTDTLRAAVRALTRDTEGRTEIGRAHV